MNAKRTFILDNQVPNLLLQVCQDMQREGGVSPQQCAAGLVAAFFKLCPDPRLAQVQLREMGRLVWKAYKDELVKKEPEQ